MRRWSLIPSGAMILPVVLCLVIGLTVISSVSEAAVSRAEDKTDELDTAMKRADGIFFLPPGVLNIRHLSIPAGLAVFGALHGEKTILVALSDESAPLVTLASGAKLSNVILKGRGANRDGIGIKGASSVLLQYITLEGFKIYGIEADHAVELTIQCCTISDCQRGINLDFCHGVLVDSNDVEDVREHGIMFWGNWNWKQKDSTNLSFSHNRVVNGGQGGIWGSGATHVVMTENEVDHFGDVGLDLEWCDDGTITRNCVSNCRNAGISLFYSCMNVSITRNEILEDVPIHCHTPDPGRWAGIWLTSPNRSVYSGDTGYAHVLIAGNQIRQFGASFPLIDIFPGSKDVVQRANSVVTIPRPD